MQYISFIVVLTSFSVASVLCWKEMHETRKRVSYFHASKKEVWRDFILYSMLILLLILSASMVIYSFIEIITRILKDLQF